MATYIEVKREGKIEGMNYKAAWRHQRRNDNYLLKLNLNLITIKGFIVKRVRKTLTDYGK